MENSIPVMKPISAPGYGTDKPLISVVLATKGDKSALLRSCLESLLNQTFSNFEIILVYKIYPRDLEKLITEKSQITLLQEKGSTLGAARNLGVKYSKGEIVAFIDDDAEATQGWLYKIWGIFSNNPSLACLGGPHLTPPEKGKKNNTLRIVEGSFADSQMSKKEIVGHSAVGKIAGCNVAYRKNVFENIGGLNERLRSGEDWDLHIRLVENNYDIRFDPEVKVWHHRQGLKHAFFNSSNMTPFYLSKRTLKYSRHESFFAFFYLSNFAFFLLLASIFISVYVFAIVLTFSILGYFLIIMIRSKKFDRRLAYFPMGLLFTLARLAGFYYGILKQISHKISP